MTDLLRGISVEYIRLYPEEAARLIEQIPPAESGSLVASLPAVETARLMEKASLSVTLKWAAELPLERLTQVASEMPTDFCSLLIRRLPKDRRTALLDALPPSRSIPIERTLDYPAHSVGAVIDPVVLSIMEDTPIEDALTQVRDSMDYQHDHLYVVNRQHQLTGIVTLREFITARPGQPLRTVMRRPALVLHAATNRSQLLEHMLSTGYEEVPVTDNNNMLLGVLRKHFVLKVDDLDEPEPQQPVSLLLSMAELFWQMTAGFLPGSSRKRE